MVPAYAVRVKETLFSSFGKEEGEILLGKLENARGRRRNMPFFLAIAEEEKAVKVSKATLVVSLHPYSVRDAEIPESARGILDHQFQRRARQKTAIHPTAMTITTARRRRCRRMICFARTCDNPWRPPLGFSENSLAPSLCADLLIASGSAVSIQRRIYRLRSGCWSVPLQFPRPPSEDEFFSRAPPSSRRKVRAERVDKKVERGRSNLIWWARVRGMYSPLFFPNLKKGEYPRNEKRRGPLIARVRARACAGIKAMKEKLSSPP
ncbi:hypothetical protein DBV15_04442 [Temnothorax longispinosus]|uniref:Uncharacterized protein n=1 Tax=Temnothorax longispinosus TaxID=300112 RepID=A0A4S2K8U6_9HYME|nr:hypothetical protein DBV15_04442 [Temnothorax longispinosus]